MSVLIHSNAEVFISKNSNLPIARVITQETGSGACELWEQPLSQVILSQCIIILLKRQLLLPAAGSKQF